MKSNGPTNCWEFNGCSNPGSCRAPIADDYDGTNRGSCGGRICWQVAGTRGVASPCGCYARLLGDCRACAFFDLVKEQEGGDFVDIVPLPIRRSGNHTAPA